MMSRSLIVIVCGVKPPHPGKAAGIHAYPYAPPLPVLSLVARQRALAVGARVLLGPLVKWVEGTTSRW